MYYDIPVWFSIILMAVGLCLLTWSANRFVDGADAVARSLGISPFVIGMVVIGFGTSFPELAVSILSAVSGHSDLSLGNAYGSNIFNIAIILGIAALIKPIIVKPVTIYAAVPMLLLVTVISGFLVVKGDGVARIDGLLSLGAFVVLLPLYCYVEKKSGSSSESSSDTSASCKISVVYHTLWIGVVSGIFTYFSLGSS